MTSTETGTRNVNLARKVRAYTRKNARVLDMGDWFFIGRSDHENGDTRSLEEIERAYERDDVCGTTACFAGWTVLLAGYRLDEDGFVYNADGTPIRNNDGHTPKHASTLARDLLGIDYSDGEFLFYCNASMLDGRLADVFGPSVLAE
jgi:hypothetical protein